MAVFRFLINVDKCLDITHYNCFFYKLKSRGVDGQGLFHLSEVQLLEDDPLSLRGAVTDIRMYMDKYPYEVDDYRIILLMRMPYERVRKSWEDTLLYRLLRLRYDFLKSNIMLSSALEAKRENALNFVMLYDSDFGADMQELKPYFSSDRLRDDIELFLKHYGVDVEKGAVDDLKNGLEQKRVKTGGSVISNAENYSTPWEADFIFRYQECKEKEDKLFKEEGEPIAASLAVFAKEMLTNYRVYERYINRSDRREETLAFLRITDFVNHDTEPRMADSGNESISTLAQRCDDAWEEVWSDDNGAKQRFSDMLSKYSARLCEAERILSKPVITVEDMTRELPPLAAPEPTDINGKNTPFGEGSEEKKRRENILKKLKKYSKKKLFLKSFREDWNTTYGEIKEALKKLEGSLKVYAQDLCNQYADILAERKKDTFDWRHGDYAVQPSERERLVIAEEKRNDILSELKKPHMNPSISFQDVLNCERRFEQSSKNISFYLDCMRETTILNFILILLVCAGFFVLHYTVLQTYNFSQLSSVTFYLCYIGIAIALMTTVVWLPYKYYSKRVQNCIAELSKDLEVYMNGYEERAKYFYEYINCMNMLDYYTRYCNLLNRALEQGRDIINGKTWHHKQVVKHIECLNFFGGLIDGASAVLNDNSVVTVSVSSMGQIYDVMDCPIYWPQE